MPRLIEKTDSFGMPLAEMARVGNIDPQISVWVYHEPLGNPSFHIKHKTDFEIVVEMKNLTVLEVKTNKSRFSFIKKQKLPGPIQSALLGFLDKKNEKINDRTNLQVLNDAWKLLND